MHRAATRGRRRPRLIVLAGLPGSGKSSVAARLASATGGVWLRVDTLEAAMLKAGLRQSFETGVAAYVGVADVAREQLRLGRTVVVDAVNGVEEARALWRSLERECGASRFVIELVCSDPAEHRRRVERRGAPTPPLPVPTWAEVTNREYLPWSEPTLVLDTRAPLDDVIRLALRYVAPVEGRGSGTRRRVRRSAMRT